MTDEQLRDAIEQVTKDGVDTMALWEAIIAAGRLLNDQPPIYAAGRILNNGAPPRPWDLPRAEIERFLTQVISAPLGMPRYLMSRPGRFSVGDWLTYARAFVKVSQGRAAMKEFSRALFGK